MTKKTTLSTALLIFVLVFSISIFAVTDNTYAAGMKVTSSGIKNGVIQEKYGMYGKVNNYVPTCSIPFTIKNPPKGTKYYAIYMYDPDGGNWTHWLAANYSSKTFPEDASRIKASSMVQGKNSFKTIGYGGPTPPDKTHTYTIKIYALKSKLDLKKGFTKKQFLTEIMGKVAGTITIEAKYIKKKK